MAVINQNIITFAKADLSKGVYDISLSDVYGLKNCKRKWGALIAKHLILDMFDNCVGGSTLNQSEADCLLGKLSEDLTINCC